MEIDAAQKDATHACQPDVPSGGPDLWLRGNELKRVVEFIVQRVRGFRSILTPPTPCFLDVPCRTTSEDYVEA